MPPWMVTVKREVRREVARGGTRAMCLNCMVYGLTMDGFVMDCFLLCTVWALYGHCMGTVWALYGYGARIPDSACEPCEYLCNQRFLWN